MTVEAHNAKKDRKGKTMNHRVFSQIFEWLSLFAIFFLNSIPTQEVKALKFPRDLVTIKHIQDWCSQLIEPLVPTVIKQDP